MINDVMLEFTSQFAEHVCSAISSYLIKICRAATTYGIQI